MLITYQVSHQKLRDWTADSLKLDHFELLPELVEEAELIVFVEGSNVKFLKHLPEIQHKDSVEVLVGYITSTVPVTKTRQP